MIFSTLCIGEEWCKNYSDQLNELASKHKVYVLTDFPSYFNDCNTILYTRNEFSYYERLVNLFKVCLENKQRVTHIDANKINHEKFQMILSNDFRGFDNYTIYCARIFHNEAYPLSIAHRNPTLAVFTEAMESIEGVNFKKCNYIDEKIISIPYNETTNKLFKLVESVQTMWEKLYPKNKFWEGIPNDDTGTHESNKWSKQGCGYGEGGALSIFAKQLNINKEVIKSGYKIII